MAHVGKRYKVAFRRDFNLNVQTNRFGWANRYLVKLTVASNGPGLVLDESTWDAGPPILTAPNALVWKTPVQEFGFGLRYWIEVKTEIQGGTSFWKQGFVYSDNFNILVAHWQWEPRGGKQTGFLTTFGGSMLFWDDQHFFTNPFLDTSAIDEKQWSDGAPQ